MHDTSSSVTTWLTSAVLELHGLGDSSAFTVVQRHLHVQLGLGIHALEVTCAAPAACRGGIARRAAALAGLAVEFHVQNAGVEGFLLQGMPQSVVIEFDQLGLAGATVDDAGRLA
jgi:hypothetical protein